MLKLEKRIRFNENDFDEDGNIRASSLLHSFQDIAAEHACILGVGREHLMEKDWIWVLSKVKFKVYEDIEAGKDYVLATCPRPKKGLVFPRDYYLRAAADDEVADEDATDCGDATGDDESDVLVAAGMSQWCIINFLTRKLERNDVDFQGQCIERVPFAEGIEKIRCSAPQDAGSHLVTEDDLDVNRHVNNCKYADMVSEVLAGSVYRQFVINFSKEARLGDKIFLFKEKQSGGVAVMGKLEDGSTVFQALVG